MFFWRERSKQEKKKRRKEIPKKSYHSRLVFFFCLLTVSPFCFGLAVCELSNRRDDGQQPNRVSSFMATDVHFWRWLEDSTAGATTFSLSLFLYLVLFRSLVLSLRVIESRRPVHSPRQAIRRDYKWRLNTNNTSQIKTNQLRRAENLLYKLPVTIYQWQVSSSDKTTRRPDDWMTE